MSDIPKRVADKLLGRTAAVAMLHTDTYTHMVLDISFQLVAEIYG